MQQLECKSHASLDTEALTVTHSIKGDGVSRNERLHRRDALCEDKIGRPKAAGAGDDKSSGGQSEARATGGGSVALRSTEAGGEERMSGRGWGQGEHAVQLTGRPRKCGL